MILNLYFHIAVALILKERYKLGTSLEMVSKAPLRPNPPKADKLLRWVEVFNTRNIRYIPAFESLGPPFYPAGFKRGTLNLIEGFETTSK